MATPDLNKPGSKAAHAKIQAEHWLPDPKKGIHIILYCHRELCLAAAGGLYLVASQSAFCSSASCA